MAQVSVNYPVVGQANSTEDPKVVAALQALVTAINALDDANIASGANINATKLLNSSIETGKLADNAVTTAKIADSQVTSAKIVDGTIATADLADSAVTSAKIADGTIATGDIANGAVTSDKIADGTIVNGDISAGTITPGKLAPVVGEATLTADVGLSFNAWNTVATVSVGQAGWYVFIASGTFGGQNSNNVLVSLNTPSVGGTYATWGMLVNGNPYGSFSKQGIAYSTNGVINLAIFSYSGKQSVGAGTSLNAFRIG